MKRLLLLISLCATPLLSGCSNEGDLGAAAENHVWEDQVEAIDEARDVKNVLGEAAAAQLDTIDAATD